MRESVDSTQEKLWFCIPWKGSRCRHARCPDLFVAELRNDSCILAMDIALSVTRWISPSQKDPDACPGTFK